MKFRRNIWCLCLGAAVLLGARQVRAQGTVTFANNGATAVSNCLTLVRVPSGSTFQAALFSAPDGVIDEAAFVQAGATASFTVAGVFSGGTRVVPGAPPGGFAMFQVRVWETAFGATWAEAMAAGPQSCRHALLGKSIILRVALGDGGPAPPGSLVSAGLKGFYVCPQPCVTLSCPTNLTVNSTNLSGSNVAFTVTGGNNCGCVSTVTCVPASGSLFALGTTPVACTNSDGVGLSITCSFTVTVRMPPLLISQPTNLTVNAGDIATFSVIATGSPPPSFQWRFNGSNLVGANLAGLTFTNVQVSNAGNYSVVLSNAAGVVTSQVAVLTVRGLFRVINTNDAGAGSLRQAILDANAQAGLDTIAFNIPGGGVRTIIPLSPLPFITDRAIIDGYTQPGASANSLAIGDNAVLRIELSGVNAGNIYGLGIGDHGCTVRGLVINQFTAGGIGVFFWVTNTLITGNFIGTDAAGSSVRPNGQYGVQLNNSGNIVGGDAPSARNIISGNDWGIYIGSGTNNQVLGNYLGTDASGSNALPNFYGVAIFGGSGTLRNNVISGNTAGGVFISGAAAFSNVVAGNYIGLAASGAPLPNEGIGVLISGSPGNTIGGAATGAGNVISGNFDDGVRLYDTNARGNHVAGNIIGLNPAGTAAIPNAGGAVVIENAPGNRIGGILSDERNVLSGNDADGVFIHGADASSNVVLGNYIGTQSSGSVAAVGNVNGVVILDSPNNLIGGLDPGAGNLIAGNTMIGVRLFPGSATNNGVLGNRIFAHGGLDIDLGNIGVRNNDAGDLDDGPNHYQNFPVLTSASTAGGTAVRGTLNSRTGRTYRLEFYASSLTHTANVGEARFFLGAASATTDGAGNAGFAAALLVPITPGFFVSATATDPDNNTSELSAAVPAVVALNISSLSASNGAAGTTLTISGTNFSVYPASNIVYFGAVRATVISASPDSLTVAVPPGASYGPVSVTVAGLTAQSRAPFVPTFTPAHALDAQSFAPKFNLSPSAGLKAMAVGDLDGDGRPDLVTVRNGSSTGSIYRNIEPGSSLSSNSFAAPISFTTTVGSAVAVTLGDLDADGLLDLVVLTTTPDRIVVLRNLSAPGIISFASPQNFDNLTTSPQALVIADFDGDGLLDVVAAYGGSGGQAAVLRNTSTAGNIQLASRVDFPAGNTPVALAVADFDGDGKPDLLVADAAISLGTLSVLRNTSTPGSITAGSFAPRFGLTNASTGAGIVAADFDGDGKLDIAITLPATNRLAVYRNISTPGALGPASFALPANLACAGGPSGLAVADLDGDGKLDLLCANTNATNVSVFWNLASPGALATNSFAPRLDLGLGFRNFAVAAQDFDADGKPDVVAIGNSPDAIGLRRNAANEPTFRVNGQTAAGNIFVTNSALVQIVSRFTNGLVFYTLDGSPPMPGDALYTNTFTVSNSVIIRVLAYDATLAGFAESLPLGITVVHPLIITLHPVSQTVGAGANVLFTGAASGNAPLAYQWQRNGVNIPGANDASLILTNVTAAQSGDYRLVITNPFASVTSSNATLLVQNPPGILSAPGSLTSGIGATETFTASAAGAPPLVFQWRKNGANIAGATNGSITITNIQYEDCASYTVVVSGPGGAVTTLPAQLNVFISSTFASNNFAAAPEIVGDSDVTADSNVNSTREALEPQHAGKPGSNSVWYTWTAPARGIATFRTSGSTFDTLLAVYTGTAVSNLTVVAADDDSDGFLTSRVSFNAVSNTTYRIAIDGFNGQKGRFVLRWDLERTNATLPVITCHPAHLSVLRNASAPFSVSATGSNLTYQWRFNGTNIPGATAAAFTRVNVQTTNVGLYSVRVTGAGNRFADSLPAILEISSEAPRPPSAEKPDDVFPLCAGSFAPASVPSASVAIGSIGYQNLVPASTNNVTDCITTNCGGIPRGTRFLELAPEASGLLVLDTAGSLSRTKMWVCRKGVNNLDLTRTFITCDGMSAPDGRSLVRFNAEGGRAYQVWIARLDNINGPLVLNWKLGVAPRFITPLTNRFLREGDPFTLNASATNTIAPGVTSAIGAPDYKWYHNGVTLVGNGATLTIPAAQMHHAGQYSVVVSNEVAITSAIVRVEIYGRAEAPVVPVSGVTELFANDSMTACGTQPVTYQWRYNGQPITGENARRLLLRNIQTGAAGQYSVTVSNCIGAVTYTVASLAVTVDVGFNVGFLPGGGVILRWLSVPGKHYRVEHRATLGAGPWLPLGIEYLGYGPTLSATDQPGEAPRFYRIVLLD